MTRDDIINEIQKLSIDKDELWVVGSASLVMRGLLDCASDIDIAVSELGFRMLKENHELIYLGNNGCDWYKISDIIECCVDEKNSTKVDVFEPYNLLNLQYYYDNFLKNSKRDKDREKKVIIKIALKMDCQK